MVNVAHVISVWFVYGLVSVNMSSWGNDISACYMAPGREPSTSRHKLGLHTERFFGFSGAEHVPINVHTYIYIEREIQIHTYTYIYIMYSYTCMYIYICRERERGRNNCRCHYEGCSRNMILKLSRNRGPPLKGGLLLFGLLPLKS